MDTVFSWLRRRSVTLPVRRFDASKRRWSEHDTVADPATRDALTLATFNTWFDDYHADARRHAIADLLAVHAPDVMVFQEMTPPALAVLLDQEWIRRDYACAESTGRRTGNYGMVVLSRLPLHDARYVPLPTHASRGFLHARLPVGAGLLGVGCVHLDSGKTSSALRNRQLDRIFGEVSDDDDAVLLGDFNMRDDENHRIRPPFTDVWPRLRPDEPGYTEDTTINLTRLDSTGKQRHVRFDRVLLKGVNWRATDIELLGTEPVSAELPRVFPSDHFGVLCRIERAGFGRIAPG